MQGVFTRPIEPFALSVTAFFQKIDEFFTPQFDTYQHLTFLNNPTTFKWLILGIYFGLVLAALVMFYNKNILGALVRRLDKSEAFDAESAKTLEELGCKNNIFLKLSLKAGNSLRKVIALAPAEGEELSEDLTLLQAAALGRKCSPKSDRFYLPKSKRDVAVGRFNAKGSGWLSVILMAAVGLVAVIVIIKFAPNVAGLIESVIDGMSSDPVA